MKKLGNWAMKFKYPVAWPDDFSLCEDKTASCSQHCINESFSLYHKTHMIDMRWHQTLKNYIFFFEQMHQFNWLKRSPDLLVVANLSVKSQMIAHYWKLHYLYLVVPCAYLVSQCLLSNHGAYKKDIIFNVRSRSH